MARLEIRVPGTAIALSKPIEAPYRRSQLCLARRGLWVTSFCARRCLSELKRINPDCRVTFYTDFAALLRGLPFVDELREFRERPEGCIGLEYEAYVPPRRHIAEILGDKIGVRVRDVRPSCAVNPEIVSRFHSEWRDTRRPRIIVNRFASSWTPNKDWPDAYWGELLDRLSARCSVIEIGAPAQGSRGAARRRLPGPEGKDEPRGAGCGHRRGRSSRWPGLRACPHRRRAGGPGCRHLRRVRAPVCSGYPGNINLYSPVHCARHAGYANPVPSTRSAFTRSSRRPSRRLSIASGHRHARVVSA